MLKLFQPLVVASRPATTPWLSALALVLLGLSAAQPARAAEFSGICPQLGSTQPAYPSPSLPSGSRGPSAVPQAPVWVTTAKSPAGAGRPSPICAVYMSANQSGKAVPTNGSKGAKVDQYFPDLTLQPWYHQGPGLGNSVAVDWANSLSKNGYWDLPNTLTPDPDDRIQLSWSSAGQKMLVNEKIGDNRNQSDFSPYFLWDIDQKRRQVSLSSEVVSFNKQSKSWQESTVKPLSPDEKYWYWVLDAPTTNSVPGPLPLLGAGVAFGWARRLRQRVRQGSLCRASAL